MYSHNITSGFSGITGGAVIEIDNGYLCVGRCWFPNDGQGEMLTTILVDKETGVVKDIDALPDENSTVVMTGNQLYLSDDGIVHLFSTYWGELYVFGYEAESGEYMAIDTVRSEDETIRFSILSLYSFKDDIFEFWGGVRNWDTEVLDVVRVRYNVQDGTVEQRVFYEIEEELFAIGHVETDSSIVIFGQAADRRLLITEVSNQSEQLWTARAGDFALLRKPSVLVGPDGYVYIPAVKYRPNSNSGRVPAVVKYDLNAREIVWSKIIGIEYYSPHGGIIDNIIPSTVETDMYFVAAETQWYDSETDSLYLPATVTKISSDGDIQWSREYRYHEANGVWHQLHDIEPTSDGNYICFGEISWLVEPPDSIESASLWLFKINEDGYIVGAGGGVSTEDDANAIDGVQLWPNPIQSELYINQDDLTDVTYTFYTGTGQLIDKIVLDRPYQSLIVATGHWPSGMLTVAITQRGKLLGSQQLVKM